MVPRRLLSCFGFLSPTLMPRNCSAPPFFGSEVQGQVRGKFSPEHNFSPQTQGICGTHRKQVESGSEAGLVVLGGELGTLRFEAEDETRFPPLTPLPRNT